MMTFGRDLTLPTDLALGRPMQQIMHTNLNRSYLKYMSLQENT